MPADSRTLTRVARDLQSASNRLALVARNHNRDTILAVMFQGTAKGEAAAARLQDSGGVLVTLEAEVRGLREELGGMLDRVLPAREEILGPPDFDEMTEPSTRKRKKRK